MQNGHHTQLDGTLWIGAKIKSVKKGRSKSPRKANHVRQKTTVCIHSEANERSAARQRWNRSRDGNPGGGVTGPEGGEEDGEDGPIARGKGSVEPNLDLAVLDADAVHHVWERDSQGGLQCSEPFMFEFVLTCGKLPSLWYIKKALTTHSLYISASTS